MTLTASEYHDKTGYDRHKMSGHFLDWENQPSVYKTYPGIEPIEMPRDVRVPETMLSTLLSLKPSTFTPKALDMADLSSLMFLTYSFTAKARQTGGEFYYRSVASAGALFPGEIYLLAEQIGGLKSGLYHFSIARHGLSLLRKGALANPITGALQPSHTRPPMLTFFLTAIFFRSSWKYRDRAYRYHLLDTGHLLENLVLALKAHEIPFHISYDFDDREINRFLGLDEQKEVALAVVQIPGEDMPQIAKPDDIPELSGAIKDASRVSSKETDYPLMREAHRSGLEIMDPTGSSNHMVQELGIKAIHWSPFERRPNWLEKNNYAESVILRRSRRNFISSPLSEEMIRALLAALSNDVFEEGFVHSGYKKTMATGFLIGHAQKFESGFYLLDADVPAFGLISTGLYMEKMAQICLDQMWLANASMHVLFMTNLEKLDQDWGARGYRYAMLTAGRLGERLYLVSTALGLGCCGIGALYDWEAAALLGFNEKSRLLYLVGLGPIKAAL